MFTCAMTADTDSVWEACIVAIYIVPVGCSECLHRSTYLWHVFSVCVGKQVLLLPLVCLL